MLTIYLLSFVFIVFFCLFVFFFIFSSLLTLTLFYYLKWDVISGGTRRNKLWLLSVVINKRNSVMYLASKHILIFFPFSTKPSYWLHICLCCCHGVPILISSCALLCIIDCELITCVWVDCWLLAVWRTCWRAPGSYSREIRVPVFFSIDTLPDSFSPHGVPHIQLSIQETYST